MPLIRLLTCSVMTLLLLASARPAVAQAYCALRDPVQTIYALYPTATSFRSLVATVDEGARADIARQLGVTLHHDELGRHTLYVALHQGTPVGLVQVRAERTKWGLAEFAWALDFDLHVVGFRVQRSRSGGRSALERDDFLALLRGSTTDTLSRLLVASGSSHALANLRLSPEEHDLAVAALTSGIKTIATSRNVWGKDIGRLKASIADRR